MEDSKLSEFETQLYDRSIRLWGLEAQKRLKEANILFVGFTGLSSEICKNVVLAGVAGVSIIDDQTVSKSHLNNHIFALEKDLGKNIAKSSEENIQKLNPLVSVKTYENSIFQVEQEFFQNFSVMIVSGIFSKKNIIKLNKISRENEIKFIYTQSLGYFGYYFTDLIIHNYTYQEKTLVSKKRKFGEEEPENEYTEVTKEDSETYLPLENIFETKWSKINSRIFPKIYYVLHSIWNFEEKKGKFPNTEDLEELNSILQEMLKNENLKQDLIPSQQIIAGLTSELNPICAILGGILGQEIIRIISQKDKPNDNFFCFNSLQNSGISFKINP